MLPKECLAHPWIAKHRAKASSDTHLERPAEGPVMDKKQMMRYNAKRKFRVSSKALWISLFVRGSTYSQFLLDFHFALLFPIVLSSFLHLIPFSTAILRLHGE